MVISALEKYEVKVYLGEYDADGYITKPFKGTVVLDGVNKLLGLD